MTQNIGQLRIKDNFPLNNLFRLAFGINITRIMELSLRKFAIAMALLTVCLSLCHSSAGQVQHYNYDYAPPVLVYLSKSMADQYLEYIKENDLLQWASKWGELTPSNLLPYIKVLEHQYNLEGKVITDDSVKAIYVCYSEIHE